MNARILIALHPSAVDYFDILDDRKKFVAVTEEDVIVTPEVGDRVEFNASGGRKFLRAVTHVQASGDSFFLSLRPLGSAEV